MASYISRRLAYMAVVLLFASLAIFLATHVLPGSPANLLLGETATAEDLRNLEQRLGWDRPVYVQFVAWLANLVQGNWGQSFIMDQPVSVIVLPRLRNSLVLASLSLILVIIIAIPLGVVAAVLQGSIFDLGILTFSFVGISVPEFVIGTALILIFAGPELGWLPSAGYAEISRGFGLWAQHLVLPVITITLVLMAHIVRLTRAGMVEVLQSKYVDTAILKGASYAHVVVRHGLRNGLVPAITVIAMDVGYLLGSLVIVEEVFAFPGLGQLIVASVQTRDVPVLEAAFLIVAAGYLLANLAADIIYTYLDPRIRYSQS